MLEKVENYIRQWKMLEKGDKVVVGLSGGADSVCLFLILEELRKKIGFEILAVHVNHGIRGEEAKADEEFVKTLCEEKRNPMQECFGGYSENGSGIQDVRRRGGKDCTKGNI